MSPSLLSILVSLVTRAQASAPQAPGRCYNGGVCAAPVSCAPHYLSSLLDPAALCSLAPGRPGVCCPPHIQTCECEAIVGLVDMASDITIKLYIASPAIASQSRNQLTSA